MSSDKVFSKPTVARYVDSGEDKITANVFAVFEKYNIPINGLKGIIKYGVVGNYFHDKYLENEKSKFTNDERHKKLSAVHKKTSDLISQLALIEKDPFMHMAMKDLMDFNHCQDALLDIETAAFKGGENLATYTRGEKERMLICAIQGVYEEATQRDAIDDIQKKVDGNKSDHGYSGTFYFLVSDIFELINAELPSGRTICNNLVKKEL